MPGNSPSFIKPVMLWALIPVVWLFLWIVVSVLTHLTGPQFQSANPGAPTLSLGWLPVLIATCLTAFYLQFRFRLPTQTSPNFLSISDNQLAHLIATLTCVVFALCMYFCGGPGAFVATVLVLSTVETSRWLWATPSTFPFTRSPSSKQNHSPNPVANPGQNPAQNPAALGTPAETASAALDTSEAVAGTVAGDIHDPLGTHTSTLPTGSTLQETNVPGTLSDEANRDIVNRDIVNRDIVNRDIVNRDITSGDLERNLVAKQPTAGQLDDDDFTGDDFTGDDFNGDDFNGDDFNGDDLEDVEADDDASQGNWLQQMTRTLVEPTDHESSNPSQAEQIEWFWRHHWSDNQQQVDIHCLFQPAFVNLPQTQLEIVQGQGRAKIADLQLHGARIELKRDADPDAENTTVVWLRVQGSIDSCSPYSG